LWHQLWLVIEHSVLPWSQAVSAGELLDRFLAGKFAVCDADAVAAGRAQQSKDLGIGVREAPTRVHDHADGRAGCQQLGQELRVHKEAGSEKLYRQHMDCFEIEVRGCRVQDAVEVNKEDMSHR
jgi:hypothetical protein